MISLIIPHVPKPELNSLLDGCLQTLSDYDELILVVNDAIGYGKAFNWGFKYARGDFLLAVSNDTRLIKGSLKDLCDETAVTYSENAQWGCFFCLPRWIYQEIGGFDERFVGAYWEDDDFLHRLNLAKIPVKRVPGVIVEHVGGATVKALGKESEYYERNQQEFKKKWQT